MLFRRCLRPVSAALLTLSIGAAVAPSAMAEPGGCLKYGAVGAVGGHYAHRHTFLGAAGGCAVGMYRRHHYRKEMRNKAAAYDSEHVNGGVR